ncbi:hypothetical protein COBT_000804 [Conglomerata obtusa]
MPINVIKFSDDTVLSLKCCLIAVIDKNFKKIELLMPQWGVLTSYLKKTSNYCYTFTSDKQIFTYVCFLQLFEIFLILDWTTFVDTLKQIIIETEIKCKYKSATMCQKYCNEILAHYIKFYTFYKIFLNDISMYLLVPYISSDTFKRYVNLIQLQNVSYVRTFVRTKFKCTKGKIKLTNPPIFTIARLFFASEIIIDSNIKLNDTCVKYLIDGHSNAESININVDYYSNVHETIFCESKMYRLLKKSYFERYHSFVRHTKSLIFLCFVYLENTSNEWQDYKLGEKKNFWFEKIKLILEEGNLSKNGIQTIAQSDKPAELRKTCKNQTNYSACSDIKTVAGELYAHHKDTIFEFLNELNNEIN